MCGSGRLLLPCWPVAPRTCSASAVAAAALPPLPLLLPLLLLLLLLLLRRRRPLLPARLPARRAPPPGLRGLAPPRTRARRPQRGPLAATGGRPGLVLASLSGRSSSLTPSIPLLLLHVLSLSLFRARLCWCAMSVCIFCAVSLSCSRARSPRGPFSVSAALPLSVFYIMSGVQRRSGTCNTACSALVLVVIYCPRAQRPSPSACSSAHPSAAASGGGTALPTWRCWSPSCPFAVRGRGHQGGRQS